MADRTEVFTIADGQTQSNEIEVQNDGLFSLDVPSNFDGTNLAIYARAKKGSALGQIYSWEVNTRTAVALTDVAADDVLWLPTPIGGVYSIALVAAQQTDDSIITPRWGRLLE
jgi:hypothetical protein